MIELKGLVLASCLAVVFMLLFGCTGQSSPAPQPMPQAPAQNVSPPAPAPLAKPTPTPESVQNNSLKTVPRNGYINLKEIGGEGLNVMSVWKPNASVSSDGKFTTEVSSIGAQLVIVTDKNGEVRASAISLPEDENLVFDAKSTTKASLWLGGSATQEEGTKALALIETFKCYPDMYAYMKANLKQKSLTKIANFSNSEYMDLQIKCSKEILSLIKMPSISEEAKITQSESNWKSARPLIIFEHSLSASSGNGILAIQNMDASGTMTVNSISLTTGSTTKTVSTKMAFAPGELKRYPVNIGLVGEANQIYELQISINYTDSNGKQNVETGGSHALVGRYV